MTEPLDPFLVHHATYILAHYGASMQNCQTGILTSAVPSGYLYPLLEEFEKAVRIKVAQDIHRMVPGDGVLVHSEDWRIAVEQAEQIAKGSS